jgi:hypothetical protein
MAQVQVERRLTENERHEKIMDYVRKYPRKKTKADVMRYMRKWTSDPTSFKDITHLIKEGRLLVLKDKPNSQVHHLIVNNDSKYNQLEKRIDESLQILVNTPNDILPVLDQVGELGSLAAVSHAINYFILADFANEIKNIEPKDKREMLYLRLVKLLEVTNEVSGKIMPYLVPFIDKFFEKASKKYRSKSFQDYKNQYENFRSTYFYENTDD